MCRHEGLGSSFFPSPRPSSFGINHRTLSNEDKRRLRPEQRFSKIPGLVPAQPATKSMAASLWTNDDMLDGTVHFDRRAPPRSAKPASPAELSASAIECQPCSCSTSLDGTDEDFGGGSGATTPPNTPDEMALPLPHYARRRVSFADQQGYAALESWIPRLTDQPAVLRLRLICDSHVRAPRRRSSPLTYTKLIPTKEQQAGVRRAAAAPRGRDVATERHRRD